MIKITYNRNKHSLRATGHAGAGPKGHDLVCAAVSTLVNTVGAAAVSFNPASTCTLEDGNAKIVCKHSRDVARYDSVVTVVMDSICNGFALLETTYPDLIKYTVL